MIPGWLTRRILMGLVPVLVAGLFVLLFPGASGSADEALQNLRYHLRGEEPADSSIVVLYLDNEDIGSLGGWPLRRSYYALLVNALHDLGVRSVGIDIAFSEPDIHGAEYDSIFASVMTRSGSVVLSGYFRQVGEGEPSDSDAGLLPRRFTIAHPAHAHETAGRNPVLPVPVLCGAASGFGHSVILPDLTIPLFIRTSPGRAVPSLGAAVLAGGLRTESNSWPDEMVLNYRGGTGSLRLIPVVHFLQSYAEWKEGRNSGLDPAQFRGTSVLIGVIAEGRSSFVRNPFTDQYPSIGVHATMMSNLMRGDYLRTEPAWMNILLTLLVGMAGVAFMTWRSESWAVTCNAVIILLLFGLSHILFVTHSIVLPTAMPATAAALVTFVMTIDAHRNARRDLRALVSEKRRLTEILGEKESRVHSLEESLRKLDRSVPSAESVVMKNEIHRLTSEIQSLRDKVADVQAVDTTEPAGGSTCSEFEGIVYDGKGPMAGVVDMILKVADTSATVLVLGESGTGKELVARALHRRSSRAGKPFIAINCGGLTETLLESELFGYEKGAFTGAAKEKPGRFTLADGGTIFLDEIGETSEAFQVKLLRVLQDGTFEPVGGTGTRKVDVRIIAATNKDLARAVEERQFRKDLYYRLNVVNISIPPLRERSADLPFLVEHILSTVGAGTSCSAAVLDSLCAYAWKGNVRELQAVLTRASLIARSEQRAMLRMKDLPEEIVQARQPGNIEEQIVTSLRQKKFSRSAISETAEEMGGLNRGTVAEHFRGYCFSVFRTSGWNIRAAVDVIAGSQDEAVVEKVEKKLKEYIGNAVENIDKSLTLEENIEISRPKFKNLPLKYHQVLTDIITSAFRGEWAPLD
jgi:transcriptional regulator with PAS, ATPase and Fis domain/CHASE2 domain-containing sensor protein